LHLLFLAAVLGVKLVVQRSSLDLLDTLPIAIVLQNSAAIPQTIRFARPAEYAIELRAANGTVLWTSAGSPAPNGPSFPGHARTFAPGSTTLAIYDWNELLADGTSPPPGAYTLRVYLVTDGDVADNSVRVTFAPPISPSSLSALPSGKDFTLAGELDAQRDALSDERGSTALSRRLLAAPANTPILVRGFSVVKVGAARIFNVERWAVLKAQPESSP
jgi:hypothetical protein